MRNNCLVYLYGTRVCSSGCSFNFIKSAFRWGMSRGFQVRRLRSKFGAPLRKLSVWIWSVSALKCIPRGRIILLGLRTVSKPFACVARATRTNTSKARTASPKLRCVRKAKQRGRLRRTLWFWCSAERIRPGPYVVVLLFSD